MSKALMVVMGSQVRNIPKLVELYTSTLNMYSCFARRSYLNKAFFKEEKNENNIYLLFFFCGVRKNEMGSS